MQPRSPSCGVAVRLEPEVVGVVGGIVASVRVAVDVPATVGSGASFSIVRPPRCALVEVPVDYPVPAWGRGYGSSGDDGLHGHRGGDHHEDRCHGEKQKHLSLTC
nr:hypothetical protein [Candidatus Njordarchaeota archaeon]